MVSISVAPESDYRTLAEEDFIAIYSGLIGYLIKQYGISVSEEDTVDEENYKGSYDTQVIIVKGSLSTQHKLFLVAHLFGHCVQWCTEKVDCAYIEELMLEYLPSELQEADIVKLKTYEEAAAQYAVQVLAEASSCHLDQWFSDWSHADWNYFMALNDADILPKGPESWLIYGSPLIPARAIPIFERIQIKRKYAY